MEYINQYIMFALIVSPFILYNSFYAWSYKTEVEMLKKASRIQLDDVGKISDTTLKYTTDFLECDKPLNVGYNELITKTTTVYDVYTRKVQNRHNASTEQQNKYFRSQNDERVKFNKFSYGVDINNLSDKFEKIIRADDNMNYHCEVFKKTYTRSPIISHNSQTITTTQCVGELRCYEGLKYVGHSPNGCFTIIGNFNGKQFIDDENLIIKNNISYDEIMSNAEENYKYYKDNIIVGIASCVLISIIEGILYLYK